MDFGTLVQTFGFPLAALIIVVWAFTQQRVIPGATHRQMLADRDANHAEALAYRDEIIADLRAQRDEGISLARQGTTTTAAVLDAATRRGTR